jgi:hypothetical protein
MKFELRLCITTDEGAYLEQDVFAFSRTDFALETIGLTLEDSKGLLKAVQQVVVEKQVKQFLEEHQHCQSCQKPYRIKGYHSIKYSTVFGNLELVSPRLHQCECQSHKTKTFSPLVSVLTQRSSPELVFLETKWASLLSYGLTTKLIKDVLPVHETLNAVGIRQQVFEVAARLEIVTEKINREQIGGVKIDEFQIESDFESQRLEILRLESQNNQKPILILQLPDGLMTVGIDGGFIRARGKQGWFEVIAGKSMVAFKRNVPKHEDSSSSKCFSFVQTFDKNHKHRFQQHLKAHGLTDQQKLEFFSDGGESVRGLQRDFSPNANHILDWFHITMRLTVLGQYAKGLPDALMLKKARANWEASTPDWQDLDSTDGLPGCSREIALESLEKIKNYLWHGNSFRALEFIDDLLLDLHVPNPPEETKKLLKGLLEFRTYVHNNQGFIVNYGERYHHGERISTGFVESTVNYVLAKRFSKKQSMQWTITGAHYLLQVRTRVLNGDLETEFRKWYPLFRTSAGGIPEVVNLESPPRN